MNEILSEAGYQEYELRWSLKQAKSQPIGQLLLFDLPAPQLQTPPRATSEEIGKHILALLGGRMVTRRNVYSTFAEEPYFASEIDKALRHLKKQEKAFFEGSLRHNTSIKFVKN